MHLDAPETSLLSALLDDLSEAFSTMSAEDPVRQRLFPDGYRDDPDAASEFRQLTESALETSRVERLGQCRAELSEGRSELELDPEDTQRWLRVLNDVRLALGTRLGISEDDADIDPNDPDAHSRVVYYWLTSLQDSLVQAAMG